MHTHTHTYAYLHKYTHTYVHTYTNTYTYIHTYIHTNMHTYTGQRGGPAYWSTPQLLEPLLGKHIINIECGSMHGVALGFNEKSGKRRVYTWGWNSHGQLGLTGVAKVCMYICIYIYIYIIHV